MDGDRQSFDARTDYMLEAFQTPVITYHHGIMPGKHGYQKDPAIIGKTISAKVLRVEREGELALSTLRTAYEGWFPNYMSGEEIPPTN